MGSGARRRRAAAASFEYVPLGPFLGKSFATSISPWVVTVDALKPHLVAGLAAQQDPEPLDYLADSLYWTAEQQLAHLTVNGAATRPGDLLASGTISGPDTATQAGSLIERQQGSLEDGDEVVLRGGVGEGEDRVGFGELAGRIRSMPSAVRSP